MAKDDEEQKPITLTERERYLIQSVRNELAVSEHDLMTVQTVAGAFKAITNIDKIPEDVKTQFEDAYTTKWSEYQKTEFRRIMQHTEEQEQVKKQAAEILSQSGLLNPPSKSTTRVPGQKPNQTSPEGQAL